MKEEPERDQDDSTREIQPHPSVFQVSESETREANKRPRLETIMSAEDENKMILAVSEDKKQIFRFWVTTYIHEKPVTMMVDTGSQYR